MTERAVDCGACGAPVPLGRLSCPACGELLASVSGGLRAGTWSDRPSQPSVLHDVVVHDDAADGLMALAVDLPDEPAPTLFDLEPAPVPEELAPEPDPEPRSEPEPAWSASPEPESEPAPEPRWPPAPDPHAASEPQWPASPAPVAPPPGAYVPPAAYRDPGPRPAVMAASAPLAMALPAGPVAPARAWAPATAATAATDGTSAEATESAARLAEGIGWVAIAGGVLAMLGFVVPWARTMIGSGGDSYIDNWGLAGPGHVVFGVALGVIIALTVVPNRVPAWLRLGIPGLILGSVLVGLVWPYAFGPLGPQVGTYLTLLGAVVLGAAAIACLVTDRHGGEASGV